MKARNCLGLSLGILAIVSLVGCSAREEPENGPISRNPDKLVATGRAIEVAVGADYAHLSLPAEAHYSYTRLVEPLSARASQLRALKNISGAENLQVDLDSGFVSFDKGSLTPGAADTERLPAESAADARARDHLSRLGLLPDDAEQLVLDHIGGINNATYDPDKGQTVIHKHLVTVTYGRKIGSLPVKGNSRIVVRLGKDGELAHVVKKWTKVAPAQAIPSSDIKPADEAVADMKTHLNSRYARYSAAIKRMNIAKLEYVMYDDGNTIEPALFARGTIQSAGGAISEQWIVPLSRKAKAHYLITEKMPDATGPKDPGEQQP